MHNFKKFKPKAASGLRAFTIMLKAISATLTLALCNCTSVDQTTEKPKTPSASLPNFSWTLPKTTFDVTANISFKGCSLNKTGGIDIATDIKFTVNAHGVPDPNLGALAPNGWVSLDVDALKSFWQDHQFEIKTEQTTHLLGYISSTATDQTGQIVGNILSFATKAADLFLGVPTGGGGNVPDCGSALADYKTIQSDQIKLATLSADSAQAKSLTSEISAKQAKINITVTKLGIDPGVGPNGAPQALANGPIARLWPTTDMLKAAGWYNDAAIALLKSQPDSVGSSGVDVYLDFRHANPPSTGAACPADPKVLCVKQPTQLTQDAFYREPAYIPVVFYRGNSNPTAMSAADAVQPIYTQTLPFAQFGISRRIDVDAPTFGKSAWSLTFNDFGETTDSSFGSIATGVAATGILNNAVTAASSIDASSIKAAQALPSTIQEIQTKNTIWQAWITNQSLIQQCAALAAKGAPCP